VTDDTVQAIDRDVRAALTPYLHDSGELAFPMQVHMITARAPV
jgi:hypothetical protein